MRREKDDLLKRSLLEDAKSRIESINIPSLNQKFKFEQAYEAVREIADAFLARDGYKTYSHEAALSYLKKLNILNDVELERLDICRKKRNDSKYYGKKINDEEAESLISFLKEILKRAIKKIK